MATHPPWAKGLQTAVRALHDAAIDLALCDVLQEGRTKLLHVAAEGSSVLAVLDDVGKMAARLHDVRRQIEHLYVAAVEGDDARGGVVHHQSLDHVVQCGIEPLPFQFQPLPRFTILSRDIAHDQVQHQRDHPCRQSCGGHQ